MAKERQELSKLETSLIIATAGDLIPMLREKTSLVHVKQAAFDYFDKETDDIWQVQVIVTRKKSDFLEFLQTEEMSEFKPKQKS